MNTNPTRKGKHREDKTMIAAYITPEVKALAMLVQDRTSMSFTDMIVEGIYYFASQCGLYHNGAPTAETETAMAAIVEMLNVQRRSKSSSVK